jgi:hypothetical protein
VSELLNSETSWLNLTNIALGLAVLVCVVAVGRVVIHDLRVRVTARRRRPIVQDDHAFSLSSLGITMADGGEPIDENSITPKRQPSQDDDPPSVIRSDD